jgi:tRNA pseudouridine55 synthase
MTSHDVVDRVRRLTGIRKVGHAGTLDPFATGLLIVLVGRATRLSAYFTPLDKEYRVTVQFGAASTTGDIDGEITPAGAGTPANPVTEAAVPVTEAAVPVTEAAVPVTEAALRDMLPRFTGVINQQAHAYSAVKVGGERLYRKARRGEPAEAPVREVKIHRLDLDSFDEQAQAAVLTISCSKGTYIRKLCEDIAVGLGTVAYAAELRRFRTGKFGVELAAGLDQLGSLSPESLLTEDNPSFISCLGALYFLPVREVDDMEARAVAAGRAISGNAAGPVRVAREGRLMAIYGPGDNPGQLRPRVVLA